MCAKAELQTRPPVQTRTSQHHPCQTACLHADTAGHLSAHLAPCLAGSVKPLWNVLEPTPPALHSAQIGMCTGLVEPQLQPGKVAPPCAFVSGLQPAPDLSVQDDSFCCWSQGICCMRKGHRPFLQVWGAGRAKTKGLGGARAMFVRPWPERDFFLTLRPLKLGALALTQTKRTCAGRAGAEGAKGLT